ncbi:HTH-type transcriptional regulator YesS [compost metagenome]
MDKSSAIDILIFQPSLIGCHGNWPQHIRFTHSFITGSMLREHGIPLSVLDRIGEIFQAVHLEMAERQPYYPMFVTGKMLELCGLFQRVLPCSPVDARLENKRITGLKTMQDIIQHLEASYMQPLTLSETASHFGMSTFHFCRLFQSLVGTNFKDYLNAIRADAAEERILSGEESITTVAMECGFNNIRTFNRVFKSVKGYTPSSLRG